MRIKSITKTDGYKHTDFRTIQEEHDKRDLAVYTPDGFQPILDFQFIQFDKSKIIDIENGHKLVCHFEHVVQAQRNGKPHAMMACQLDPTTDKLISYDGQPVSFTIQDGDVEDFYDIQIPDPHWYYTSSVVSHNSILMCNNAITSLKGTGSGGEPGQDVLLITFELDTIKTAMRCLGVMANNVALSSMVEKKKYVSDIVEQVQRTYKKRFLIVEWPPDECSVSHIYALLDNLKRTDNWKPDVIIIDYMDLMVSRNDAYNKDDYTRQKHVASEIRGLAKNENAFVITATQTNRSATSTGPGEAGGGEIDMSKAAESYAKQFSLDYVVSLNQSRNERLATPARIRMYIAKNRNGPKNETVECTVEYETMVVRELTGSNS